MMKNILLGIICVFCALGQSRELAAAPIREFDARILAVDSAKCTVTLHHNATQYTVTLRTDGSTDYQRIRQAPFAEFPGDRSMRFWGAIDAAGTSITIQGVRRGPGDDNLKPAVVPAQNHIAGRLLRTADGLFIDVGDRRVRARVDPHNFEGAFEEPGAAEDLQPERAIHVRYEEEPSGGHALAIIVYTTLPPAQRPPSPPSGATPEQVQATFNEIKQKHAAIAPELSRLMPVAMEVAPELAKVGEPVTLKMEVLADSQPNAAIELVPDLYVDGLSKRQGLALPWQTAGARDGRTVYRAELKLPAAQAGAYRLKWRCDAGGDIAEFTRHFAVIDDSYAVCIILSTSHHAAGPGIDLQKHSIPYEQWIGEPLEVNRLLNGNAETWAAWSREYRQFGTKVNPHLFGPYWVRGTPVDPQANLQAESPDLQMAILRGYRETLPRLGFGSVGIISAYTMDNSFVQAARDANFRTISSLCSGQNFMDGPMRINHFGMPDRPYFIGTSDFRQAGPGGPAGLVGIPQCQRNTFLCREFNCTYCLEPAWNDYYNEGGGRREIDDLWMSRMYDFFDAMLQNRLSQSTPYFFNVGLEFNGVAPGITEANRLLIEYAARKARTERLVFSTGEAVSDYYRRHFRETPETTCYQQDYFGGLTKLDKFAGYPDTLEIEGAAFKALMRAPDVLPAYQYDYQRPWNYPAWGNEDLVRNRWGYLYPGRHDPFAVVPKIIDTRLFEASREDSEQDGAMLITLTVQARTDQKKLVLALWDLNRAWRAGSGWWNVQGPGARFVPVRAPFTENLNGLLVCDVAQGENRFVLRIDSPPRRPVTSTVRIGESIEGRVFRRDGQWMAYLWPTKPWEAELVLNLPANRTADAYVAPIGERQPLQAGRNCLKVPAGKWMRLTGLSGDEILAATR